MKKYSILLLIFLAASIVSGQTSTTIEDIISNPGNYNHEQVVFEGFITRYVAGTSTTTSYYEVQGDYGARIRVNTSQPSPEINERYRVTGTVTIHSQEPLVIENTKTLLDESTPPPPPPDETDNTLMIVIIIGLLIIVALIVYFSIRPKPVPASSEATKSASHASLSEEEDTMVMNKGQSFDTIRYEANVPTTMKFIPGKLEILNNPDKGKSFMLAGHPTPDGSVSTIGRDYDGWDNNLSGERKYAHIRIKDESKTLSRMQAEIIYRDKKLYLKNLSKVNPSQVDGYDVPANDLAEVKDGSVIKAGFIEFRYKA